MAGTIGTQLFTHTHTHTNTHTHTHNTHVCHFLRPNTRVNNIHRNQALFPDVKFNYDDLSAEEQAETQRRLRAVLPNNHSSLDGAQQLEYVVHWTTPKDEAY